MKIDLAALKTEILECERRRDPFSCVVVRRRRMMSYRTSLDFSGKGANRESTGMRAARSNWIKPFNGILAVCSSPFLNGPDRSYLLCTLEQGRVALMQSASMIRCWTDRDYLKAKQEKSEQ